MKNLTNTTTDITKDRVIIEDNPGYIYVPYIPVVEDPIIIMGSDICSKKVRSKFGKKILNGRFYGTINTDGKAIIEKSFNYEIFNQFYDENY